MGEEDLSIGVIGLGLRRNLAAAAHRPGRGSRVGAVADLDPGVRHREAERFGARLATGIYQELLDDDTVDAVIIATPTTPTNGSPVMP